MRGYHLQLSYGKYIIYHLTLIQRHNSIPINAKMWGLPDVRYASARRTRNRHRKAPSSIARKTGLSEEPGVRMLFKKELSSGVALRVSSLESILVWFGSKRERDEHHYRPYVKYKVTSKFQPPHIDCHQYKYSLPTGDYYTMGGQPFTKRTSSDPPCSLSVDSSGIVVVSNPISNPLRANSFCHDGRSRSSLAESEKNSFIPR